MCICKNIRQDTEDGSQNRDMNLPVDLCLLFQWQPLSVPKEQAFLKANCSFSLQKHHNHTSYSELRRGTKSKYFYFITKRMKSLPSLAAFILLGEDADAIQKNVSEDSRVGLQ